MITVGCKSQSINKKETLKNVDDKIKIMIDGREIRSVSCKLYSIYP